MNTLNNWEQLKDSKFKLQPHTSIIPLTFRGIRWYLIKNELTGDFTRLDKTAYALLNCLDGSRTLEESLDIYKRDFSKHLLEHGDILSLVSNLVHADTLKSVEPLIAHKQHALNIMRDKNNRIGWVRNPLSLKFPLINPNNWLTTLNKYSSVLFTKSALLLWSFFVITGITVSLSERYDISHALDPALFSPNNLAMMLVIFILIKLLHELGHAFAIKHWGGHVNEIGITLLVFNPVPYVDASASWAFQEKRKRIVVSAMGILTEIFIASVAIVIWSLSEPGLIKTAALNSAIVASVSTLVFNANPLLKFDGYYVLQDLIEIPNLYKRSQQYLIYVIQKYVLNLSSAISPEIANKEFRWLFAYGIAALAYRLFLLTIIVVYLIDTLFILGIAIALWAVYSQIIRPLIAAVRFLKYSPLVLEHNNGTLRRTLYIALSVCIGIFLVPMPNTTYAQGAVWIEKQSQIYSSQDGYVKNIYIDSGTDVNIGDKLLQLSSPTLTFHIEKLEATRRELQIKKQIQFVASSGKITTEISALQAIDYELTNLYEDRANLTIRAKSNGRYFSPNIEVNKGRFLKRGEFVGYIFSPEKLVVQAIFPQVEIGKIREKTKRITLRLAENTNNTIESRITRETPSATSKLPSNALGANSGGIIEVEEIKGRTATTTEDHFQIDFELLATHSTSRLGGIVHIRIDHTWESLFHQLFSAAKQKFIRTIKV